MAPEAEHLAAIAAAMLRAREAAGPAMLSNFIHPEWAMAPPEFVAFWGGTRLASVATYGTTTSPHAAPLEVTLSGATLIVPTFADTLRLRDMAINPRVVITTWDDAWHAAIVYGRANVGERAPGGRVEVVASRIYAIRAPAGHHAHRP